MENEGRDSEASKLRSLILGQRLEQGVYKWAYGVQMWNNENQYI
jgi:hypothetical protein